MRPLFVESIKIRSFRNLENVELTFGERFNVIAGGNGQGKTNVLEAIYVLATSKSFRSAKVTEVISFGASVASVRGLVRVCGSSHSQSVGLKSGTRTVRIDEKRPPSLAAYAVRTPVVVFHPGELGLSMGSSSERRRLLDRTSLYMRPESLSEVLSYGKAVRARQRTLATRGVSARDLADWETLCVQLGLAVVAQREEAASLLSTAAESVFAQIAEPGLVLRVAYAPGAPRDAESFRASLEQMRPADLRRGSAAVGPHRDELSLSISGRGVRGIASQGQHRAVTLALKSAEIQVIGRSLDLRPVLLLDDVSSELDRDRTAALFAFLRDQEGQVLLSTTRPDLIDTGSQSLRANFLVRGGRVMSVS
jgi:DNA replication and repair protein RecF